MRTAPTDNDETRLVRISVDLAQTFGLRAENGDRLSFKWGEPEEYVSNMYGKVEPVYVPTVTRHEENQP